MHTRAIGSRLTAKMGYIRGQGLGKFNQGIPTPIVPQYQHDKLGIGFLTAGWPNSELQQQTMTGAAVWPSWDPAKKIIADAALVFANPWEGGTSKAPEAGERSILKAAPPSSKKATILCETEDIPFSRIDLRCQREMKPKQSFGLSGKKRQEDAIEGVEKQQLSGNLTLSSLMDTFSDLKRQFAKEFETCDLYSVAANLTYPLLVELFWGWKPVEELLHGLLLMSSSKDLLLSRQESLDDASLYGNLVRDVVLPMVKEWGASSWNARDPQPMITFLELWELLLPRRVRELILEVVLTKLLLAVESWDPRIETTPIHVWVHPWSELLGTRLDLLYETIRVKMGRFLESWNPNDRSVFDLLSPWKYIFDSVSWEKVMVRHIIPKLKSALQKNKQRLEDQFDWVMR